VAEINFGPRFDFPRRDTRVRPLSGEIRVIKSVGRSAVSISRCSKLREPLKSDPGLCVPAIHGKKGTSPIPDAYPSFRPMNPAI